MKLSLTIIAIIFFFFGQCQKTVVLIDTLGVDSLIQVYYNNGHLFYQIPYLNGRQNGWREQYHENGAIWTKELMINGKTVDGYNIAYSENGKIYQEGYFKNGHEIGKWKEYKSDGKPFKIYIYNRKGDWIKLKVWNEEKQRWEKTGLY